MTKLFYKDKPVIGLDISQTGIKVMTVDPKKWLVTGYGSVDLDPTKVQASLDSDDDYLTESLKDLLANKLVGTYWAHFLSHIYGSCQDGTQSSRCSRD